MIETMQGPHDDGMKIEPLVDIAQERLTQLLSWVQELFEDEVRNHQLPAGSNPMFRLNGGMMQIGYQRAEEHRGVFWVLTYKPNALPEDNRMPFVAIFQGGEGLEQVVDAYGSERVFDLVERYFVTQEE